MCNENLFQEFSIHHVSLSIRNFPKPFITVVIILVRRFGLKNRRVLDQPQVWLGEGDGNVCSSAVGAQYEDESFLNDFRATAGGIVYFLIDSFMIWKKTWLTAV